MQVRHAWYSDDMHGVSPGKKEQPMAAFVYVNSDSCNAVCVCACKWMATLTTYAAYRSPVSEAGKKLKVEKTECAVMVK